MALEAGANAVQVAFRLGHMSTRMVEQHYAGRLDRADKKIAGALAGGTARLRHAEGSASGPGESASRLTCSFSGADDGIRTRDPHLGKVCRNRWSEPYTASEQRNPVTVIPVVSGRD
jgi:hypothetical protein